MKTLKKVLLVAPIDYESVGGYYLPINHYIELLRSSGYDITVFKLPYHVLNKKEFQKYRRELVSLFQDGLDVVISFGLNQCTYLTKLIDARQVNGVAFLIDCMRLHAESVLPYKNTFKEKIRTALRKKIYTLREKKCLNVYKSAILVSKVDTDYACSYYNARRAAIHYIPNGIDIPKYNCLVKRELGRLRLGCLTGFSEDTLNENLYPFIKGIFPYIHNRFPEVQVIVAGRGCKEGVRKVLDGIDGLIFEGEVERLEDFYSKVDVIITTVRKKCGIINRVMEAWAYGRAVMGYGSNFKTFTEAMPGREYIKADTKEEFADSIGQILSRNIDINKMGEDGRKMVSSFYTWEESGHKLVDIIQTAQNME